MLARSALGLALAIYFLGQSSSALACACCTNEGQRNVATVALDSGKQHEIESLRFGSKATLFTGEGDVEGIQGIATPAGTYKAFGEMARGQAGAFVPRRRQPHRHVIVDASPNDLGVRGRPARPARQGPGTTLYKEWKLSAPASGSGVFQPGIARRQILTLILQGRRQFLHLRRVDFTHWTLVMQGPKANYTLYGDLV